MDNMVLGIGSKDNDQDQLADEIESMASQGFSEQEIISELRDEGYSNKDINKAIQKILKYRVNSEGESPSLQKDRRSGQTNQSQQQQQQGNFVAPSPDEMSPEEQRPNEPFAKYMGSEENPIWEMTEEEEIQLEELIEEIIEEKWSGVRQNLQKMETENENLKNKIYSMEERIQGLEEKHQKEKEKLEDKVDRTFNHIENIEARVNSVEKAFKEFLPSLTENVRSLSGIVNELKQQTNGGNLQYNQNANVPSAPQPPQNPMQQEEDSEEEGNNQPSALE
ncbi:MAG: hypothetical protein ACLFS3_03175 [Candidatus Aenigmatarchaeota archaeon]